jgi:hypothetical protein
MEAYNQNVNYPHTVFRCGCAAYIGMTTSIADRRGELYLSPVSLKLP